MRVLLDISVLGLGHVRPELRGGTFRVHEHLAEGIARAGACELSLCANYSSVAYAGCVEYLRTRDALRDLPLLGPPAARGTRVGRVARSVHGVARRLSPRGVLPAFVSRGAQRFDRRLHPQVHDVPAGADVFHSLGARLPTPVPGARAPQRVVNIYDLAPVRLAPLYGSGQRDLAEARLAGIGPTDWVMTTSEASRSGANSAGSAASGTTKTRAGSTPARSMRSARDASDVVITQSVGPMPASRASARSRWPLPYSGARRTGARS